MKLIYLQRGEEYYRPGVWKIYYMLDGVDYKGVHGSGPYLAEIKFSGSDAEQRSLVVFNDMKKDLDIDKEIKQL